MSKLSKRTTHCPSGHLLVCQDKGVRTPPIPASSIGEVLDSGWCDVCIEPFLHDERYSCEECSYDACWRCFEKGRENYLVTCSFETGPMAGEVVYGTLDVEKKNIIGKVPTLAEGDADVEMRANGLLTFDFELNGLTWGNFPDEKRALAKAKVAFSVQTGEMTRFELLYDNANAESDLESYGRSVARLAVNCGFSPVLVPLDQLSQASELKPDEVQYIGVQMSKLKTETIEASFGNVSFRRYGLIEVPGFGEVEVEDQALALLRTIAKNKRMVIDPMRQVGKGAQKSLWNQIFPKPSPLGNTEAKKLSDETLVEQALTQLLSCRTNPNVYREFADGAGKIHHKDLIYCSRLSLLAYLTKPVDFSSFFPASREVYLLDPIWINFLEHLEVNEGKELLRQWLSMNGEKNQERRDEMLHKVHEMFVGKFVAGFFDQDKTSSTHGQSLPLSAMLGDLGLTLDEGGCTMKEGTAECFLACSTNLATEGGDIVLTFQGTNEAADYLISMNGYTTPFEPFLDQTSAGSCACLQGRMISSETDNAETDKLLRVHLGFYNSFLAFKPRIQESIESWLKQVPKDKNVRIVVTGHSLGGALASMATAWLLQFFDGSIPGQGMPSEMTGQKTDRLRVLCVTFGAPKIGIPSFVEWMDHHPLVDKKKSPTGEVRFKILRIIDVQDPVVTLPPESGVFNYMHTMRSGATIDLKGNMIFISEEEGQKLDHSIRGVSILLRKGSGALLYHDLFVYLHKTLHFAWRFKQLGESDMDWTEDPLIKIFGDKTYRYDGFTKSPEFLVKF